MFFSFDVDLNDIEYIMNFSKTGVVFYEELTFGLQCQS